MSGSNVKASKQIFLSRYHALSTCVGGKVFIDRSENMEINETVMAACID